MAWTWFGGTTMFWAETINDNQSSRPRERSHFWILVSLFKPVCECALSCWTFTLFSILALKPRLEQRVHLSPTGWISIVDSCNNFVRTSELNKSLQFRVTAVFAVRQTWAKQGRESVSKPQGHPCSSLFSWRGGRQWNQTTTMFSAGDRKRLLRTCLHTDRKLWCCWTLFWDESSPVSWFCYCGSIRLAKLPKWSRNETLLLRGTRIISTTRKACFSREFNEPFFQRNKPKTKDQWKKRTHSQTKVRLWNMSFTINMSCHTEQLAWQKSLEYVRRIKCSDLVIQPVHGQHMHFCLCFLQCYSFVDVVVL